MKNVTDKIKQEIEAFVARRLPDHDIYVCDVRAFEDLDEDRFPFLRHNFQPSQVLEST